MTVIPLFKVFMAADAAERVRDVLQSGMIAQGPAAAAFERALCDDIGTPDVVCVSSGTAALTLACRMIARPGKTEVLVPALTCAATAWAVLAAGLKIRWADCGPHDGNLSPEDVKSKIGPDTAAVIAVHWGGTPCDLSTLRAVCDPYGVPIIEDAAHAWGAKQYGARLGLHGNYVCHSFQAIKHLTTGDGGCLICPNGGESARARRLRWFGLDRSSSADFRCEQIIPEWGYKFHMNDVAAAIGLANLPHVAGLVERHRDNARKLDMALRKIPGLEPAQRSPDSSAWVYTVLVENRDHFQKAMRDRGVHVSPVHSRLDVHTAYFRREPLPGIDALSRNMTCLPCGWWVTDDDIAVIERAASKGW